MLCRAVGFRQAAPSASLPLQTVEEEQRGQLELAAPRMQSGFNIPADNHGTSSLRVALALPASAPACGCHALALLLCASP